MTYKALFPTVVERDREVVKDTVIAITPQRQDIIDAIIESTLEDAFLRGVTYGKDSVLNDPSSYDLFSLEERD